MSLSVTRSYANGAVLTEAELDAAKSSIETFFNTTLLTADNVQDSSLTTDKFQDSCVTTTKLADHSVTRAKLDTSIPLSLSPIGGMVHWPSSTPPAGWLICDGSLVSRTVYADLFAVISTTWGTGNGVTTFNLPDAGGYFLRGWDNGQGRDPNAATRTITSTGSATGDNVGSYQADTYLNHSHAFSNNKMLVSGSGVLSVGPSGLSFSSIGTASATLSATGGNETRPINAMEYLIIKY